VDLDQLPTEQSADERSMGVAMTDLPARLLLATTASAYTVAIEEGGGDDVWQAFLFGLAQLRPEDWRRVLRDVLTYLEDPELSTRG
jgi:hypothetical protein